MTPHAARWPFVVWAASVGLALMARVPHRSDRVAAAALALAIVALVVASPVLRGRPLAQSNRFAVVAAFVGLQLLPVGRDAVLAAWHPALVAAPSAAGLLLLLREGARPAVPRATPGRGLVGVLPVLPPFFLVAAAWLLIAAVHRLPRRLSDTHELTGPTGVVLAGVAVAGLSIALWALAVLPSQMRRALQGRRRAVAPQGGGRP